MNQKNGKKKTYKLLEQVYFLPKYNSQAITIDNLIKLQNSSETYYCPQKITLFSKKKIHSKKYDIIDIDRILRFVVWKLLRIHVFFKGIANSQWYYHTLQYLDEHTFQEVYGTQTLTCQFLPKVFLHPMNIQQQKLSILNLKRHGTKYQVNRHLANNLQAQIVEHGKQNQLLQKNKKEQFSPINAFLQNNRKKFLTIVSNLKDIKDERMKNLKLNEQIFEIKTGVYIIDDVFINLIEKINEKIEAHFSQFFNLDYQISKLNLEKYERIKDFCFIDIFIKQVTLELHPMLKNFDLDKINKEYYIGNQKKVAEVILNENVFLRFNYLACLILNKPLEASNNTFDDKIIDACISLCQQVKVNDEFQDVILNGVKTLKKKDCSDSSFNFFLQIIDGLKFNSKQQKNDIDDNSIIKNIDISILSHCLSEQLQLANKNFVRTGENLQEIINAEVFLADLSNTYDLICAIFQLFPEKEVLIPFIVGWQSQINTRLLKAQIFAKVKQLIKYLQEKFYALKHRQNEIQNFLNYAIEASQIMPFSILSFIQQLQSNINSDSLDPSKLVTLFTKQYTNLNKFQSWKLVIEYSKVTQNSHYILYSSSPKTRLLLQLKDFAQNQCKFEFVQQYVQLILAFKILVSKVQYFRIQYILKNIINLLRNVDYDIHLENVILDLFRILEQIFLKYQKHININDDIDMLRNWIFTKFERKEYYTAESLFFNKKPTQAQQLLVDELYLLAYPYVKEEKSIVNKKKFCGFTLAIANVSDDVQSLYLKEEYDSCYDKIKSEITHYDEDAQSALNNIDIVQLFNKNPPFFLLHPIKKFKENFVFWLHYFHIKSQLFSNSFITSSNFNIVSTTHTQYNCYLTQYLESNIVNRFIRFQILLHYYYFILKNPFTSNFLFNRYMFQFSIVNSILNFTKLLKINYIKYMIKQFIISFSYQFFEVFYFLRRFRSFNFIIFNVFAL